MPILRFTSLADIPWRELAANPGSGVRLIVQSSPDVLPLDVIYIPRGHERLLVGLHGLENRAATSLPKFQFVRSFLPEREESLLFLSDSTLLCGDKVSIAWMGGTPSFDVAEAYSLLISSLVAATGVTQTVLAGHSAGGTAAIRIGARVPNSVAVAVNPQFNAQQFHAFSVNDLRNAAYPHVPTNDDLLAWYPTRFDLRPTFRHRYGSSRFYWFSHVEDTLSFGNFPSWPLATGVFGLPEHGGETTHGDHFVLCDWHTDGELKHALPGSILPFIRYALGEDPRFDLRVVC